MPAAVPRHHLRRHEDSRVSGQGDPRAVRRARSRAARWRRRRRRRARSRASSVARVSVVKAQIHAGGRGKGGGVKVVKSAEEAEKVAAQILGMQLVTHQTGPAGQKVSRVLVEEGLAIARELYLGMLIDRATQRTVLMASSAGGMDIEEVAEKTPHLILKEYVDPGIGLHRLPGAQARLRPRPRGRADRPGGQAAAGALRRVHRHRRLAHRDQPADRHQGGQPARARRQGHLRRQRAVPAQGLPGAARHRRRGSARGRGVEVLAELHPPRRHHRLHGQRRRPGHGDDGHHQAGRRRAGQLPRRRRRRQRRADQERLPHPDGGHEREGAC